MGAGVGLSTAGLQTSAIEALDPSQAGVAAGLFSTSRYIGSFAGSIALARLLDHGHGLAGFHAVFLIALAARDRLGARDAGAARAFAVDRVGSELRGDRRAGPTAVHLDGTVGTSC